MVVAFSRSYSNLLPGSGNLLSLIVVSISWWIALSSSCLLTVYSDESQNQHNLLLLPTSLEALECLQQECRLWSNQSLRSTSQEIAQRYGIAIWIDRRIDPTQIINLKQADQSANLRSVLDQLVLSCGAEGGLVENVFLIAPPGKLARIQRAAVVLHGRLSSAGHALAQTRRTIQWDDITSSGELLELVQYSWSAPIGGTVPHDLLHAGTFPRCSLATQLSILLGGFDLQATFAVLPADTDVQNRVTELSHSNQGPDTVQEFQLKVEPLSPIMVWRDRYKRSFKPDVLARLAERFPDSNVEILSERQVSVHGPTNLHIEVLAAGRSKEPARSPGNSDPPKLYSFNIDAKLPVEVVLENLGRNFGFQIEWSDQCTQAHRNRLIQFRVQNVSRRQLLERVCAEADLRFADHETKVSIYP